MVKLYLAAGYSIIVYLAPEFYGPGSTRSPTSVARLEPDAEPAGGQSEHPYSKNAGVLAQTARFFRSGLPGGGGLYGSWQLGNRPGWRLRLWLHTIVCDPAIQ